MVAVYCNKGAHGEDAWNAHRGTDLHKHETGMVRDEPQWYETEWVPWGKARGKGKGRGKGRGRRQGTWGAKPAGTPVVTPVVSTWGGVMGAQPVCRPNTGDVAERPQQPKYACWSGLVLWAWGVLILTILCFIEHDRTVIGPTIGTDPT